MTKKTLRLSDSDLGAIEDEIDIQAVNDYYKNRDSEEYTMNDWDDAWKEIGI